MSSWCPTPRAGDCVEMAHGAGGRRSRQLIEGIFRSQERHHRAACGISFSIDGLTHDAAVFELGAGSGAEPVDARLALTTDAYVVTPRFFAGGDIGKLAVVGTLNDLAMVGALPLAITASFVLEEGLPFEELSRIARSMFEAAAASRVRLVAGDTKVVERGKGDGVYISTTGLGRVEPSVFWAPSRIQVGDVVIVSGDLGRHGMTILAARHELDLGTALASDCAPLWPAVSELCTLGAGVACLRDATRGGLAIAVQELASSACVAIELHEAAIPISEPVAGACELLGLDPLYLANEGRFVVFAREVKAPEVLSRLQKVDVSAGARMIGRVTAAHGSGLVSLRSPLGPLRPLDDWGAEQMPRIC